MKKIWVWVMAAMILSQSSAVLAQEGLPSAVAEADQMADDLMLKTGGYEDDFLLEAAEDADDTDDLLMEEESADSEDLLDIDVEESEDTLDQE